MKKSLQGKKWNVISENKGDDLTTQFIIDSLLKNRGITSKLQKEQFLNPTHPKGYALSKVGIDKKEVQKALRRIKKAIDEKQKIIIYGDYDADGVCASAIMWETLNGCGGDVMPYIPDRFVEGYGLNAKSVQNLKLKTEDLKLIITVDNGITAGEAVKVSNKMGIDVIITDHHEKGKKAPESFATIHTTETSGSGVAWFFAKEITRLFKKLDPSLELCAIGTIADQLPVIGINRSLIKHGLEELNKTKRFGLQALFNESGVKKGEITAFTVGFVIAPRINAMGRLGQAIDSLRLLCTRNSLRAFELAQNMGKTNKQRQRVVEEVVFHARESSSGSPVNGFIVVAHETYHEGVIGLAASRLVEEFYRPAIVIAKGETVSKASARSIPGVNIIEVIRKLDSMLISGGGHEGAAGFSIETKNLPNFIIELNKLAKDYLTKTILEKSLSIDTNISFMNITHELNKELVNFEPTGIGNRTPTFVTRDVEVVATKLVGRDLNHLKLKLKGGEKTISAIAFGMGEYAPEIIEGEVVDVVYCIEEDNWNGNTGLQLKIKDIVVS